MITVLLAPVFALTGCGGGASTTAQMTQNATRADSAIAAQVTQNLTIELGSGRAQHAVEGVRCTARPGMLVFDCLATVASAGACNNVRITVHCKEPGAQCRWTAPQEPRAG